MYLVITGEIAAYTDKTETPEVFKPGDSLGDVVFLKDDVRLFSARTLRAATLLMIHKRDFIEIQESTPDRTGHLKTAV